MITTRFLSQNQEQAPDGSWIPALPLPCPFWTWRLRDAWEVLRGRAEAVCREPTTKEPA